MASEPGSAGTVEGLPCLTAPRSWQVGVHSWRCAAVTGVTEPATN